MNDDLNIPLAIGIIWDIVRTEPKSKNVYDLIIDFDKALGLKLDEFKEEKKAEIPDDVVALANKRLEVRKNKNWAESDKLRDEISALGYRIKDSKDGYELEKI